jgi:hypothetical protein
MHVSFFVFNYFKTSVQQPYASALAQGLKLIENRGNNLLGLRISPERNQSIALATRVFQSSAIRNTLTDVHGVIDTSSGGSKRRRISRLSSSDTTADVHDDLVPARTAGDLPFSLKLHSKALSKIMDSMF